MIIICYVLCFVDEVMFSHNGANGPESDDACVSSSSPGGGIWGELCLFRLHFVAV